MIRRLSIGTVAALAMVSSLIFGASAAFAVYPPTPTGNASVTTTTPAAGGTFGVSGPAGSFTPGSPVKVFYKLNGSGDWVQADAGTAASDGSFSANIAIPNAGTYTIALAGTNGSSEVSLTSTVTVKSTSSPTASPTNTGGGGNLPNTGGGSTMTIALVGGALVVAGGAAVVLARRRESHQH